MDKLGKFGLNLLKSVGAGVATGLGLTVSKVLVNLGKKQLNPELREALFGEDKSTSEEE